MKRMGDSGKDALLETDEAILKKMDDEETLTKEALLISMVGKEPPLFNTSHEHYRNANVKTEKWAEIAQALGWTELKCKLKWKALRDQYCRELKRRRFNPRSSVKWKHFYDMSFLRPYALSRDYRPRNNSKVVKTRRMIYGDYTGDLVPSTPLQIALVNALQRSSSGSMGATHPATWQAATPTQPTPMTSSTDDQYNAAHAATTTPPVTATKTTVQPVGGQSPDSVKTGTGNDNAQVYLEGFGETSAKPDVPPESDEALYDHTEDIGKTKADTVESQADYSTMTHAEVIYEKKLITMIRALPVLYDKKHTAYRNLRAKAQVWSGIAAKLSKTVKQCRLKWKAMRDQFIREHKRLSTKENIEWQAKWKHYDRMRFLTTFIKPTGSEWEMKSEPKENEFLELDLNDLIMTNENLLQNSEGITIKLQSEPLEQLIEPKQEHDTQDEHDMKVGTMVSMADVQDWTKLKQHEQDQKPSQMIPQQHQQQVQQLPPSSAAVTFMTPTDVSSASAATPCSITSKENASFCILTTANNPNGITARCLSRARRLHDFEMLNLGGDMIVEGLVGECLDGNDSGMTDKQQSPITILIGGDDHNNDNDLLDGHTNDLIATSSDEFVADDETGNCIMENVSECHQLLSADDCLDDSMEHVDQDDMVDEMNDNNCNCNNNSNNNNSNCNDDGIIDEPPPYTIYPGNPSQPHKPPITIDMHMASADMKFPENGLHFQYADATPHLTGLQQPYSNASNGAEQQPQGEHEQQQTEEMAAIKSILNGIASSDGGGHNDTTAPDTPYSNCSTSSSTFDNLLNNSNESPLISMPAHQMHQQPQQLPPSSNMLAILTPDSTTATSSLTTTEPPASLPSAVSPMKGSQSPSALGDEDDEYGVFFRGLAMKIRNAKLSPQEFIDLQINILQLIKNR